MNEPWTKDSTPLFSVLIANYNNGQYLEECLQSVFAQSYTNWEIIIVDDGSTDIVSKEIYDKIKDNPKIRVFFNERNMGCGATKRRCVDKAKGTICGFLDPDDTITPNALEIMVNYHTKSPENSIIYSTHYICDKLLNPQSVARYVGAIPEGKSHLTYDGPKISHFATFKTHNYLITNKINPKLTKAVDQDLYYKLEETGPTQFINKPLYYYRHHSNSISLGTNRHKAFYQDMRAKYDAVKRRKSHTTKAIVFNNVANRLKHIAYEEKSNGNFVQFISAIWTLVIHHPLHIDKNISLFFLKAIFECFFCKKKRL